MNVAINFEKGLNVENRIAVLQESTDLVHVVWTQRLNYSAEMGVFENDKWSFSFAAKKRVCRTF